MENEHLSISVITAMIITAILIGISGCSLVKDYIRQVAPMPTSVPDPPTQTPIEILPMDTPTPVPTPDNPMWGYIYGMAKVGIAGIGDAIEDKASLFHLSHPVTGAWLNIRYRQGGKFQPKGALDTEYGCCNEINYFDMKTASDGIWIITWGADISERETWTRIESPAGEISELWFEGGIAAWREVKPGSGDARIPVRADIQFELLEIGGDVGLARVCTEASL